MVRNEAASVSVCGRGSARPGSDPLRTVVWVCGDHDYATRVYLAGTLTEAADLDDSDILVDLSGVTFMDASTIGTLVSAHNQLRACSRSLSLRDPCPLGRRILDVCGLGFLIDERPSTVRPTVATALDSWVAVPASDHDPESTQALAAELASAREEARTAAQPHVEPAGSTQQPRTPT